MLRLYARPPVWLSEVDIASPGGVAALLTDLKGSRSILEIAKATGHNRYTVSRWLKGEVEPRLPDFLCLLQAVSLRLLDFTAGLVDPAQLPSLAVPWRRLEAARRTAYDFPLSHAVLRALELEAYQELIKLPI